MTGLSHHAIAALQKLFDGPAPRQEFNPGVCRKLEQEELVQVVTMPTPYQTRSGNIEWLQLTPLGRKRLEEEKPTS